MEESGNSSRLQPGGSNSTNGLAFLPHHDIDLNVENNSSSSASRHGLSPLNTRNLVMQVRKPHLFSFSLSRNTNTPI